MKFTPRFLASTPLALALLLPVAQACQDGTSARQNPTTDSPAVTASPTPARPGVPTELYEVVKVVDGDTVHILRDGKLEKLRLLSVDTEERIRKGQKQSPGKPMTLFGEDCAQWAIEYFAKLAGADGKTRIGLLFPEGKESRGTYGRLLCHVILEDGTDFNLLLVQKGKSPYFNKYGNSLIAHEEFVAAQAKARKEQLGIWNPKTNMPATPGAPVYKRDYDALLAWWQSRADAIDNFRSEHKKDPLSIFTSEDHEVLELAKLMDDEVRVFGTINRIFDEKDGSRTLLLRSSEKDKALRIRIPADALEGMAAAEVDALKEYGRQNYAYFRGTVTGGERGYEMIVRDPAQIERAGPEPVMPVKQ